MPDQSHVGRRYVAPGQIVDAERVARFAAAVGGTEEAFAPGAVPPTFAAVYCLAPTLARLFADREVGIDLAGLIHAEQSFEWPVPVRPGDVVDASAELTSVESKRGLTFVTLDLEATNQAGETVCRGRSLLLMRGAGR
jgi:acyl dehydratase